MSRVLIILGNGFSIDLINHLQKKNLIQDKIDLTNLFAAGEDVIWPGSDKPGFLSYQHCKNLWTLGGQPSVSKEDASSLIENIITCANILPQRLNLNDKIYIKAYKELEYYLISLFILYSKKANLTKNGQKEFEDWGWVKYFQQLDKDPNIEHVDMISLNYDIWLEQLLDIVKIKYSICAFSEDNVKFRIYKPHGSIGFKSINRKDKAAFEIDYTMIFEDRKSTDFQYDINNIDGLNTFNAIIPPAGDSNRLTFSWAKEQKEKAKQAAGILKKGDSLVLCGLSYWHVDRYEIDSYLTSATPELNVTMVNPSPPSDLLAVLMTLYDNFKVFSDSKNLVKL